ncbi:MAG: sugar phosphate isomerase/epimerase [Anaerolineales bacterium]
MILAGRTQPLAALPWEEGLVRLRELGFAGAEVCLENPDLAPALLDAALAQRLHERLTALGFCRWSISYHKDLVDDRYYAETVHVLEQMPLLGADVLVIGTPHRDAAWTNPWERLVARLQELAALAGDVGVTLAEEAEPGFVVQSTGDVLRLIEDVGSPRLAANLDLGHAFLCDADPLASIAELGGRIAHVHVENMRSGVHDHRLPWDGDMDLAAYLRALRAAGFVGLAALDLYGYDYAAVAPRAIAYLRNLLQE